MHVCNYNNRLQPRMVDRLIMFRKIASKFYELVAVRGHVQNFKVYFADFPKVLDYLYKCPRFFGDKNLRHSLVFTVKVIFL